MKQRKGYQQMTIPHILLVEDEESHAELVERAFEPYEDQMTLTAVSTLKAAREFMATQQPNMVIVDFLLPDGRGTELLPDNNEKINFPMIIMTSHGDEQVAVEAMKAGAFDYVVKSPMVLLDMPRFAERVFREWGHIQERKQAEAMATWFGRILDGTLNEIFAFDAKTYHFIEVNRSGRENLGYSMAELETITFFDICALEQRRFEDLVAPLLDKSRENINLTSTCFRKDKTQYPIEINIQLSELKGTAVFVAVVLDITERVKREEQMRQQDRLAAVGQLASGIAHDFNNIMAVIILYTQIIQRTPSLPDKAINRLQTVVDQANRATDLIEQILDFSRSSVLERKNIELTPFIKEIIRLMRRTLPENILISFEEPKDICIIHADATRIQQMMMNLMFNARDAMPDGGKLSVKLQAHELKPQSPLLFEDMKPGQWVYLTISDNGTGIPADILSRVFEPFFTTKQPGRGTGLGLAQVYGIVKQHDGYIRVESEVAVQTTFSICFPAITEQKKGPTPLNLTNQLPQGHGETILLVEDDRVTREAITSSLELLNYHVLVSQNGNQAVSIYTTEKENIKLIITDMVMPEMGGVAMVEALTTNGLDIPVIILTGHPLNNDLNRLDAYGFPISWIQKPISLPMLAQSVAKALHPS